MSLSDFLRGEAWRVAKQFTHYAEYGVLTPAMEERFALEYDSLRNAADLVEGY